MLEKDHEDKLAEEERAKQHQKELADIKASHDKKMEEMLEVGETALYFVCNVSPLSLICLSLQGEGCVSSRCT